MKVRKRCSHMTIFHSCAIWIFPLLLIALWLAACSSVPMPLSPDMGILMFKVSYNAYGAEDIWKIPIGAERMNMGWKIAVKTIVTFKNPQTEELISRTIAPPNTLYVLYNIKAGYYRVEKIELLSEKIKYSIGLEAVPRQSGFGVDFRHKQEETKEYNSMTIYEYSQNPEIFPVIDVSSNAVCLYGTISALNVNSYIDTLSTEDFSQMSFSASYSPPDGGLIAEAKAEMEKKKLGEVWKGVSFKAASSPR
jgi:hypothetical protein